MEAFALWTNWKSLFCVGANEVKCLNGLKVLAMLWIIVGHYFNICCLEKVASPEGVPSLFKMLWVMFP